MVASRCCPESRRAGVALSAALLFAWMPPAQAEPEARAELTALFDSGNLLRGPEPDAPVWEGVASLRTGHDNRARLALGTSQVGLLPGVTTSALLRFELGLATLRQNDEPLLRDASSFLALGWRATSAAELELRAFPFDTDYLRLGY